jgi:hypothetical protein
MIEVEKLTKRYGPVTAVHGLTSTARPGHVTGFLTPTAQAARSRSGESLPLAGMDPPAYAQRTGRILCRRRPRRLTVLSPAAAAPTVARP